MERLDFGSAFLILRANHKSSIHIFAQNISMHFFQEKEIINLCFEYLQNSLGQATKVINTKPVGGGCINNAAQITTTLGDFFVKWNNSAPDDMFEKEALGLIELRQANSLLNIPRVVWYKKADETPGLILMEYLSSTQGVLGFDEMLGRGLAQLHRKTASAFGLAFSNYCGITAQDNTWTDNWLEFFAKRRIGALVSLLKQKRRLVSEEHKVYEKLIERLPALIPDNKKPSLIHGDLWSGNYINSAKGPALIDPACYYADREMELGMMKLFGGFSETVWNAYQEEFPLSPDWKSRIPLYQLYHVLNHYLLFGGSYGWQALEIAKSYL